MRTKDTSSTKLFYTKILIDLFSNRLFILSVWLLLFPVFYCAHVQIYFFYLRTDWHPHFSIPAVITYLSYIAVSFLGLLILRIFMDLLLSLLNYRFYRKTNPSFSKKDLRPVINNAKEYDRILARTTLLRFLKVFRKIIIFLTCIGVIAAWIPYIMDFIKQNLDLQTQYMEYILSIPYLLLAPLISFAYGFILILIINMDYNELMKNHLKQPSPFNSVTGVNFDRLSGIEFEQYCAAILARIGFEQVSGTLASHDQGVDLIAFRNKHKYAIQCKRYRYTVGNKAVQEVVAGMKVYDCHKAIVMTNNYFTPDAVRLAKANGVELVDRNMLIKMIKTAVLAPF